MQPKTADVKNLIALLGFVPENGVSNTYHKVYPQHNGYALRIDFNVERIEYCDSKTPIKQQIKVGDGTTSNFSHDENLVVLECVDRLLEKGYAPSCLELEKKYLLGRREKGKVDVIVYHPDSNPFILFECKTWGTEFSKEQALMVRKGGQLFSYYANERKAEYLCLYSSKADDGAILYNSAIVPTQEEWQGLSGTPEIVEHWNKNFKNSGIFEADAAPYNVVHKALTRGDLRALTGTDSDTIYNQIMEILRHNVVSDKPNAFNKLLNLFICKIIDENRHPDSTDIVGFQWKEDDDDYSLQMRLNDLYKDGMWRFLNIEVTDFSQDEFDEYTADYSDHEKLSKLNEMFRKLRLQKNPEFAFVEVCDDKTFKANAKVLREIVELLQVYQLRYTQKHQFLGDFFELLLNTSIKQESGQFFTPVPITKFMVSCLPIESLIQQRLRGRTQEVLPTAIDYACGSGHFLTEYMERVQNIINDIDISSASTSARNSIRSWRDAVKFEWAKNYVYGIDLDYRLVKTAKVSAFFNGDGEARIVWANGLAPFGKTPEYVDKLSRFTSADHKDNGEFDILISNPPYSVEAFKNTLTKGEESFELFPDLTDKSKEIECLFVERMKQLLKPGGWAGIILPSSILTNGGNHAKAREILLKYFDFKAIAEMGSGTFMKTGTNTVILFLKRRKNIEWKTVHRAVDKFWTDYLDVTVNGIEHPFSLFAQEVKRISFDDYVASMHATSDADKVIEKDKLLYFLLTCTQNIVLIKAGQKDKEKKFLGYEFSERRGREGLRHLPSGGLLFDEDNLSNPAKVNSYIYHAFLGDAQIEIDATVADYVSYERLSSLLVFDTSAWSRQVMLRRQIQLTPLSFAGISIGECADVIRGVTYAKTDQTADITKVAILTADNITLDGSLDIKKTVFLRDSFEVPMDKSLQSGDIFVCFSSGSKEHVGKLAYIPSDINYYAGGFMGIIRCKNKGILSKYLFYALNSIYVQQLIKNSSTGKNINNLSSSLTEIKIPLLPTNVQETLIAQCEVIDADIERTKAQISGVDRDIQSKFIEIFGDPLTNPMGWPVERLSIRFDIRSAKRVYQRQLVKQGIPFLRISDIMKQIESAKNTPIDYIPEDLYNKLKKQDLVPSTDDILVATRGTIGLCYIMKSTDEFYFQDGMISWLDKKAPISSLYVAQCFQMDSVKKQIKHFSPGSTVNYLSLENLSQVAIHIPPIEMQEEFDSLAQSSMALKRKLHQQMEELEAKRKEVLEKYL